MAKLPKLSDLSANVPGMIDKFKSFLDSLVGPGNSAVTEEALANEPDPKKRKFLEITLLLNQLNDIQVIHNRTLTTLKSKYAELEVLLFPKESTQESPSTETATTKSEEATPDETNKPETDKPNEDKNA